MKNAIAVVLVAVCGNGLDLHCQDKLVSINENVGTMGEAKLSQDGKYIAYTANKKDGETREIYITEVESLDSSCLTCGIDVISDLVNSRQFGDHQLSFGVGGYRVVGWSSDLRKIHFQYEIYGWDFSFCIDVKSKEVECLGQHFARSFSTKVYACDNVYEEVMIDVDILDRKDNPCMFKGRTEHEYGSKSIKIIDKQLVFVGVKGKRIIKEVAPEFYVSLDGKAVLTVKMKKEKDKYGAILLNLDTEKTVEFDPDDYEPEGWGKGCLVLRGDAKLYVYTY